jgi:hypothetical protein
LNSAWSSVIDLMRPSVKVMPAPITTKLDFVQEKKAWRAVLNTTSSHAKR